MQTYTHTRTHAHLHMNMCPPNDQMQTPSDVIILTLTLMPKQINIYASTTSDVHAHMCFHVRMCGLHVCIHAYMMCANAIVHVCMCAGIMQMCVAFNCPCLLVHLPVHVRLYTLACVHVCDADVCSFQSVLACVLACACPIIHARMCAGM